jgi:hypothetical protein
VISLVGKGEEMGRGDMYVYGFATDFSLTATGNGIPKKLMRSEKKEGGCLRRYNFLELIDAKR